MGWESFRPIVAHWKEDTYFLKIFSICLYLPNAKAADNIVNAITIKGSNCDDEDNFSF